MYFLGVDGGQSSTKAVIGDENGGILGRGEAGPCNHVEEGVGRQKLTAAVSESVRQAVAGAGLPAAPHFAAACFGMSGGPADKRQIIASLIDAGRLEVTTDAHIALMGATAGEPGIIVIAGTGSIAYGRNAAGRTARAGGWGHIFGDEGGGFDTARQALRAALRCEEGWGPQTTLGHRLMEATGAASVNEVLHLFYTRDYPRDRVAGYAALVDAAAQEGDAVARTLLQQAAQQLATLAGNVRGQLFAPGEAIYVAPIGGVFRSKIVTEWFRMLIEMEEGSKVGQPRHDPAIGALLEAYRSAGITALL